jgi:hypothetical protein
LIHIALAIILSVSCSLLISREKIATFFLLYQIFCAKFKAKAVFHIEGLAAKTTISQGFIHQSLASRLGNQVKILFSFIDSGFS